MSKSLGNTVGILAEPDEIWDRVRTAVTDPQRIRRNDPGRPEVCNVFSLHNHFTDAEKIPDIETQCRSATRGCVDCKRILAESIADHFEEARARAKDLYERPERVREILDAGAERARAEARITLEAAREAMGMHWRGLPALGKATTRERPR